MNAAARCMAAVETAADETPQAVSDEHRRVQYALALLRSGQYRPAQHAPTIRAIARDLADHADADVRQAAAALTAAVGDYRVNR